MTERETVKVTVHSQSIYGSMIDEYSYQDDKLTDVIEFLQEKLAEIPSDCRDAAFVDVDSVGGYEGEHHTEIEIYYNRPETDEEMRDRLRREQQWRDQREDELRQRYEALKRRFEP